MSGTAPSDALVFLETIFQPALKATGGWLLVWRAQDKRSAWFRDVAEASRYVRDQEAADTYIGTGISGGNFGPHRRAKVEDVIAVPALWLDIDILGPVHKHDDYPPDMDGAAQLIRDVGRPPNVVVHSGHGLQAWWRLTNGICATPAEREYVADAVRTWQQQQIEHARTRYGWRIDATHDLARLMRLPGTWNLKDEPTLVTLEAIGAGVRDN